ncbi:MAG: RsmD family RNA methyltransferase [Methanoregula sp.]|jgi:tRNA (guanine37-N1)-methyltransferase|uniref:class I SAM-dependent methyltransferase n=1 Tax=Methanoregula sp. TaxID=2052170 RepID=UPI003D0D46E7
MRLRDQMKGIIPEERLKHLSDRFEVIGDIAVLSIPEELAEFRYAVAEAVITRRRNISTVLNKVEKVSDSSRTAHYDALIGDTTVTLHREFGFEYRLDVSRVFFNTRMAHERIRVIDQVEPGEQVFVPFAGVGPFAIPAAAKGAAVVAVEQSPDAFSWLDENVALNHVRRTCTIIHGDARDLSLLPHHRFDRVIIPTPYGMDQILDTFLPLVPGGGMLHFYTFKTRREIPLLTGMFGQKGLSVLYHKPCGNVAPGVSRWVFDLEKAE